MATDRHSGSRRAQSTLDFAVGAGIFLIAIAFVVAFIPGMIHPFESGVQEETVAADRVADELSGGILSVDRPAYVLNQSCTVAFFDASYSAAGCGFSNAIPADERLGLADRQRMDVRIVGEDADGDGTADPLCLSSAGTVEEQSTVSCASDPFVTGSSLPGGTGSVVVSRRWVTIDGRGADLEVRMW